MTTNNTNNASGNAVRYVLVGLLVCAALLGMYRFAQARGAQAEAVGAAGAAGSPAAGTVASGGGGCCGGASSAAAAPAAGGAAGSGAAAASGGGGCCGGGGASTQTQGTAKVAGGVQKIAVDVGLQYNPNVIKLKAGVPAEITFSQAQGCTSVVQSPDLGFSEDLSSGAKTVKLKGLQPGTYGFACGMNMVQGQIVVE
jgi:hypothetical protein